MATNSTIIDTNTVVIYKSAAAIITGKSENGKFPIRYRSAPATATKAAAYAQQNVRFKDFVLLSSGMASSLENVLAWAEQNAPSEEQMYEKDGGIDAIREVKFSLTSCRGCFGGCSFCALTFHQGRIIQARSHESLIREAEILIQDPDFKGYIHDVGGPTANFRRPACDKQLKYGACPDRQCLFPKPCKNLIADHSDYVELLRKLRALPGVKKVFVRSGIRYDYVAADPDPAFLRELVKYHVSGQLRVAPEHVSDRVLALMGKPEHSVYRRFAEEYRKTNERLGKKQYLVPYLISSHPGSTLITAKNASAIVLENPPTEFGRSSTCDPKIT